MIDKNVISLQTRKDKVKLEILKEDLDSILTLLKVVKQALGDFSMYVPVRNIYISIVNNEQSLKQHLEKINNKLTKNEE